MSRSTWMRVTAEKRVDPQAITIRDRRSLGILTRHAQGCEGAKPPCQWRAPSGAHIKKPGRRPAPIGGTQLGHPAVLTAGRSARAREAVPARRRCSFGAEAATWQAERAQS